MPYIHANKREVCRKQGTWLENPGELNYALTMTLLNYIENHGEKYQTYNDVIGALECCKLEFYRRAVSPYEDKKRNINGDVYV